MLKNQKGFAFLEVIPVLVLLIILLKYTFGFFGVIHTGILNTIAGRNYAFEAFHHRTNLNYHRPIKSLGYKEDQLTVNRYMSKTDESKIGDSGDPQNWATARSIGFPLTTLVNPINSTNQNYHNNEIMNERQLDYNKRYQKDESGSDPVWVRERYGICLTAECGNGR